MAISFTKKDFQSKTKCSFWKHKSPRFKKVLETFEAYEKKPNGVTIRNLGQAVTAWYKRDPKEFANRDKTSKELCTRLIDELHLTVYKDNTLKYSTMELSCGKKNKDKRPEVKTKFVARSLEDYMQENLAKRSKGVAVILIDMQSLNSGLEVYEGLSVLQHQKSVLDCAKEYGFWVYEVRIVRDGIKHKPLTNGATNPVLSSSLPNENKLVKIDKPYFSTFEDTDFDEELSSRNITDAIVMGFDANTCVANTIFGKLKSFEYTANGKVDTPYIKGLLERKINVITSRTILASDDAALCKEYGFLI